MKELVERRALEWARECGMEGEIKVTDPQKEYFGWTVHLQDSFGKSAQARFTKEGNPSMWEMVSR